MARERQDIERRTAARWADHEHLGIKYDKIEWDTGFQYLHWSRIKELLEIWNYAEETLNSPEADEEKLTRWRA